MPPTYRPKVVDKHIENAQNDHQQRGAKLGLEPDHNHDAGQQAQQTNDDPPDRPVPTEHEPDEQEDEQDAAGQLEVHLTVFFLELRQAGEGLGLAHPRVREDHKQTSHDGEVAEEEVEVEDKTVAEGLGDHHADEAGYGVLRVAAGDDED